MTGAVLDHLLTRSASAGTLDDLWAAWRMEEISVTLPGMAAFAASASLGNKVRGALGHVLLKSASQSVRERHPCHWTHTSTAEVLFGRRPLIRLGDHDSEISRPFVFAFHPEPTGELLVRMTVFGAACDRTSSITDALIHSLSGKVKWNDLAKDGPRFVPTAVVPRSVAVTRCVLNEGRVAMLSDIPIVFLTPLDRDRGDAQREPMLIIERLARRIALLAPWHGVSLQGAYTMLLDELRLASIERVEPTGFISRSAGGHRKTNRLSPPLSVRFNCDNPWFRRAIVIGERIHIGRGASLGLGRYRIE